MTAEPATLAFCEFYGFHSDYLSGPDRYEVTGAPDGFDGRVRALTIRRNGRFGNIVLQLLHAAMLARQFRVEEIRAFPFPGGPTEPIVQTPGLRFVFAESHAPDTPSLCGEFFNSYAFQSALSALHGNFVVETLDAFLRPLFASSLDAAPADPQTAILHFRSGDIFDQPPNSTWYVQPPAAYYLRAFENLRGTSGVTQAMLVFEDRRNPAVDAVEKALREAGVPVLLTDGTFAADREALLGAVHIIASFSTFPEAAALLSHRLQSFSAFRSLESHAHLHVRRPLPLLAEVLRIRGVRGWVIGDVDGSFIAPLDWQNTPTQRQMIVDFPLERLLVTETQPPALAGDRAFLANTTDEAIRLRGALIAARLAPPPQPPPPPPAPPPEPPRNLFARLLGR